MLKLSELSKSNHHFSLSAIEKFKSIDDPESIIDFSQFFSNYFFLEMFRSISSITSHMQHLGWYRYDHRIKHDMP